MLKRTFWLFGILLIVVALVVSSCQPPSTTETTTGGGSTVTGKVTGGGTTTTGGGATTGGGTVAKGPEMATNSLGKLVEKPQYGGKMTSAWTTGVPTQIWDPLVSTRAASTAVLIYGRLADADWKKGPQGTNENSMESSYVSDEFLIGQLAESWERPDTRTAIWHLRQGVRWQNKAPMNGREFTADDVVYAFTRGQGYPASVFYTGPTVPEDQRLKITAIDKYTVKFVGPDPDGRMVHGEGQWLYMSPKEQVLAKGNLDNWRDAVGTGPWIVADVVPDSSVLFKRNPNYFRKDPFFPENQLPYLDELEVIVIGDESTRISALRTSKIDIYGGFPWDKAASMQRTNPELMMRKYSPDYGFEIFMRTDIAPLNDKRVRQALQHAVDEPGILKDYYKGDGQILGWPIQPYFKTQYTPLEQLPENLQKMYTYDVDGAKKLLAEAGFPTGLKTEVATSAAWPKGIELLQIVKENWKAAGIEVEIKPTEAATYGSLIFGKKFPAMAFSSWGNNGVDDAFGWAHDGWVGKGGAKSVYAFSSVNDPIATETYVKLMDTLDFNEREKIRKEENVREIDLAWEISIPVPNAYTFWAPYLKGFAGEAGVGPDPPEGGGITQYVWIDKALKEQMTGVKQ